MSELPVPVGSGEHSPGVDRGPLSGVEPASLSEPSSEAPASPGVDVSGLPETSRLGEPSVPRAPPSPVSRAAHSDGVHPQPSSAHEHTAPRPQKSGGPDGSQDRVQKKVWGLPIVAQMVAVVFSAQSSIVRQYFPMPCSLPRSPGDPQIEAPRLASGWSLARASPSDCSLGVLEPLHAPVR